MTNDKYLLETFLMEYPRAGIIAVIHRNYRIAMFPYHRNEDEKGLPTRDFALNMAIELRDKIKKCTTEESDTGLPSSKRNNQSSMTNKRRFKKGDLVRFINTGRHPGRCLGLVEGSLMYVQEVEDNNFEILVKDRDNAWRRLPFYEFELVEETEHEVFVRYTRDEAIILFNYQPVLRIPTRYKLGDQEVDMCEELVDWVNQIVEDLNEHVMLPDIDKTKNENESRTRKS